MDKKCQLLISTKTNQSNSSWKVTPEPARPAHFQVSFMTTTNSGLWILTMEWTSFAIYYVQELDGTLRLRSFLSKSTRSLSPISSGLMELELHQSVLTPGVVVLDCYQNGRPSVQLKHLDL